MHVFIVVDFSSIYNVILGRPFLNDCRSSVVHLDSLIKFINQISNVISTRGNQEVAICCYNVSLNDMKQDKK